MAAVSIGYPVINLKKKNKKEKKEIENIPTCCSSDIISLRFFILFIRSFD